MKIKVTTQSQELMELEEVLEVFAPTTDGTIGILPGHIDLVATLQIGNLRIVQQGGKTQNIVLNGGLIQVSNDQIMVLADEASLASELVKDEIEKAIRDAEEKIAGKLEPTELIQLEKRLRYEKFKQDLVSGL